MTEGIARSQSSVEIYPNSKTVGGWTAIAFSDSMSEAVELALKANSEINRRLKISRKNRKHGMKNTRLYAAWESMKRRCSNPNTKSYDRYGGRGIAVCGEWADFVSFANWAMSNGYADHLTLERNDPNKGYSPDNCRWATQKEQQNNRTNNHFITIDGITKTIAEWSDVSGIKQKTILSRISYGWKPEDLLGPANPGEKYHFPKVAQFEKEAK